MILRPICSLIIVSSFFSFAFWHRSDIMAFWSVLGFLHFFLAIFWHLFWLLWLPFWPCFLASFLASFSGFFFWLLFLASFSRFLNFLASFPGFFHSENSRTIFPCRCSLLARKNRKPLYFGFFRAVRSPLNWRLAFSS